MSSSSLDDITFCLMLVIRLNKALSRAMRKADFPDEEAGPVAVTKKIGSEGLELVPREGWGSLPATHDYEDELVTPVENVRVVATGEPEEWCKDLKECSRVLRKIQRNHMKKCGLPDIAFNFMLGGDGRIYEGRSWYVKPHRASDYCNDLRDSVVDLAYIGLFNKYARPSEIYLRAMELFMKYAIEEKYIKENYTEYPHYEEMFD